MMGNQPHKEEDSKSGWRPRPDDDELGSGKIPNPEAPDAADDDVAPDSDADASGSDSDDSEDSDDSDKQKRKIAIASGHRYASHPNANPDAFKPVPTVDFSGIVQETVINKEFDSRKVSVDLRYNPEVDDANVLEIVSAIQPLDKITFIDLSWTYVSLIGLQKILPKLTSLIELSYQSPMKIADFPVAVLPKSLQIVHLDDSDEWILDWKTTAGRILKPFWERSQIRAGAYAGANSYFRQVGFREERVSHDVAKELYRLQQSARSLHLQCNSDKEGAWEVPDIEKVLRVLPTNLVDLNFSCARDRKPQHPRGRSTLSEFLEDPSDPDVLGYIVRSSGRTLVRLELNIPHIPKCDLHYFEEIPNLKELILHGQTNIHMHGDSFPALKNLTHLEASIRLYPGNAALETVCSMTNLTYLNLGSDWMNPAVVKVIGNSLVNLKTLSVNGGKKDVVDALIETAVADKLETILSITVEWDWIAPYLLRHDGSPNFASLKFMSLKVPQYWGKSLSSMASKKEGDPSSYIVAYPTWRTDRKDQRQQDGSALFDDTPRRSHYIAIRFGPYWA